VHANSSIRVDEIEGSKSRFGASGLTVMQGKTAELKCPVFGNPKPDIVWRLADSRQILVKLLSTLKHSQI
jgi:hypothetical protein